VSTIGPVAAGVVLAFAWNMAVSQSQRAAEAGPGVTPRVGLTVEEAAAQAWASATPRAATDSVSRPVPGSSRVAAHPRGTGGACSRVTWPRTPERTVQVHVISSCGPRGGTAGHAPGPFGINS